MLLAVGLLWLAHIGLDPVLSYGLKYDGAARRVRPQGRLGDHSVGRKAQDRGNCRRRGFSPDVVLRGVVLASAACTCCCMSGTTPAEQRRG